MSTPWHPASAPPPPSTPMEMVRVIVYSPELREMSDHDGTAVGYYWGNGRWAIQGSPSKWRVTHWQPWPAPPDGTEKT